MYLINLVFRNSDCHDANQRFTFVNYQLSSTKTTDNKSTLLHVLVSTIESKYPEVLDVKKELESVLVAAKGEIYLGSFCYNDYL